MTTQFMDWIDLLGPDGKYHLTVQEAIIRHLALCSIRAERAMKAEQALGFADGTNSPFAGRLKYWQHVFQSAKMFALWATAKQDEQLELNFEDVQKVREEWNRQTKT